MNINPRCRLKNLIWRVVDTMLKQRSWVRFLNRPRKKEQETGPKLQGSNLKPHTSHVQDTVWNKSPVQALKTEEKLTESDMMVLKVQEAQNGSWKSKCKDGTEICCSEAA